MHVDFVRVRADQTIQAEIPVHLIGDAEGAARGGVLEQLVHTLTVEAKPGDLPPSIEHDITALEIGDGVYVRDLAMPAGVTVLQNDDDLVVQISAPRVAEEATPVEGEVSKAPRAPRPPRRRRGREHSVGVAGPCLPTSWWSGSAIPATSTRKTRHNVGAEVVELLARRHGARAARRAGATARSSTTCASAASGSRSRSRTTYMNDSGEAVAPLAQPATTSSPSRS